MHLLHGIIGACIAGIPLAALLFFQIHNNTALRLQISRYQQNEQNALYFYVWVSKRDIAIGETVKRADLEQKKAWVPQNSYPETFTDAEKITGRKAIRDLKKGTVIQKNLLSDKKKSKKAAKTGSGLP